MDEKSIEKAVTRYGRKCGWLTRKFASPHRRAAPDQIFMKQNLCFFIEFKATGRKATPLQLVEHEKLRAGGMSVYVCDAIGVGNEIVDDWTSTLENLQIHVDRLAT